MGEQKTQKDSAQSTTTDNGSNLSSGGPQSPTDVRQNVFDEVFGGPCWTEACPSPKECLTMIACSCTCPRKQALGPPSPAYAAATTDSNRPCSEHNRIPTRNTLSVLPGLPPTTIATATGTNTASPAADVLHESAKSLMATDSPKQP